MRNFLAIPVVLITSLLVFGCDQTNETLRAEFLAMGGIPIHITGYHTKKDVFFETADAYRRQVQLLETQLSAFRKNSLLSRAAQSKGQPIELNPEVMGLLDQAITYSRLTNGAFDPTVLPLIKLWNQAKQDGHPPTPEDLEKALENVGIEHIQLQHTEGKTFLSLDPGACLDLGGIAKGYFADIGVRLMQQAGIPRGLVEIGGDLVVYDNTEDPKPFQIGIHHPRDKKAYLGKLLIETGAVVTSGDYERYVVIGDKRYSHIIDPRIGIPTEQVCAVTLTAPEGSQADALATAVMVLGEKEGMKLVNRTPGVEVMIISVLPSGKLKIALSPNMKPKFRYL